jgi:hypothetical protein
MPPLRNGACRERQSHRESQQVKSDIHVSHPHLLVGLSQSQIAWLHAGVYAWPQASAWNPVQQSGLGSTNAPQLSFKKVSSESSASWSIVTRSPRSI